VVTYWVRPRSTIMGSNTIWMKTLWLACMITAVHTLPDFSRTHAKANEAAQIPIKKKRSHQKRFHPNLGPSFIRRGRFRASRDQNAS